ncbi:MAG: acyl-CoA dehydrogenase family protein [Micromonosporaceae bacterium]
MDLTLTEDQQLIADTAREVLAARRGSADVRAVAGDPAGYSAALWKEMVDLGWPGLAFDEAYGGVGMGFLELCLLLEAAGRAAVPSPLASSVACCGLPIARFGTEDQKAEWLGAIAQGRVMTYARAATGGRWGAAGSDVTVSDQLTLDGTALFVPYAQAATELLVVAQGGDPESLTVLLVDAADPGISREPLDTVGTDRMCRVTFENVSVPAERVLGEVGGGAPVVEAIEQYGAAAACAEMVGGAQGVLDRSVEYASQREQFGKPIGAFQAVQHHCANMAIDVLSSRFLAYEAIWRLSAGLDASTEVSAAKAWVSEAYQRVCSLGHQVHGAIGFTAEHDLHAYLRHAIGSALAFGDADFHTERLARKLGL